MSVSIENFIKAVYQIQYDDQEKVLSSKLALELNVSNAAITDMARKLDQSELINYKKYGEIKLTESGRKLALKVIRKHRLWELFLYKTLKLSKRDIHFEAELLEHQTTDFLINRIEEFLGHPKFDPHGDPIPDINLSMPDMKGFKTLSQCFENTTYIIRRLIHRSNEVSTFYRDHNFELGQEIFVEQVFKDNPIILVRHRGKTIALSNKMLIYIQVSDK